MTNAIVRLPTFDPNNGDLLSVAEMLKDNRNKYAFTFALEIRAAETSPAVHSGSFDRASSEQKEGLRQ
jgi:hypothetical protein